jgi:hypothetical protein
MSANPIAFGVQAIVDASFITAGTGLPVFYRVYSNPPASVNAEAVALGFESPAATGTAGGTTDILITPQPRVKNLSMRDIGQSNGKLNESSRLFVLSHTFVLGIMATYPQITEQEQVFDSFPLFVGLVYEGKLFNVAQYAHREVSGVTVSWRLTCNATK